MIRAPTSSAKVVAAGGAAARLHSDDRQPRSFHLNPNNVYMTLMMISPMAIVMLISMRDVQVPPANGAILIVALAFFE